VFVAIRFTDDERATRRKAELARPADGSAIRRATNEHSGRVRLQMRDEIGDVRCLYQGHRSTAETAAGQPRTENAGHGARHLDEAIKVSGRVLEINPRTFVRSVYQNAKVQRTSSRLENFHGPQDAVIFADDMRSAAPKNRVQLRPGPLEFGWAYLPKAAHTERTGRGRAFVTPFVVEAFEQVVLAARLRDDHDHSRRERDRPDFFAPAIQEDDVIGPAENGSDLVEETGLDADEIVLGPAAEASHLRGIKAEAVESHEKSSRRHLERGRTGKARAGLEVAGNFRGESIDSVASCAELLNHAKRVVRPPALCLRTQI
jgi:hypothetical protein